jgi:hypothetical protein
MALGIHFFLMFSCDTQHILGYLVGNLWVSKGRPTPPTKKKKKKENQQQRDHFAKTEWLWAPVGNLFFKMAHKFTCTARSLALRMRKWQSA